jgi:KDO2-lipid IV(A) lauroyltransferase
LRALMLWSRVTPRRLGIRVLGGLGVLAFRLLRRERAVAIENLTRAFPELSPAAVRERARASFRALGRNFFDVLRFPALRSGDIERICRVEGYDHLVREVERGRGVIGVMGHIGCWEMVGAVLVARGIPINAVVRTLRDPRFESIVARVRGSIGVRGIPRGPRAIEAYRALRRGEVVGLLIDQDTEVDGHFVPFFGHDAYTPRGIGHLAVRSGASLIPAASHLGPDLKHHVVLRPPLQIERTGDERRDIDRITEACGRAVEEMIRIDPVQWVWFHRRWKTRPEEPGGGDEASAVAGMEGAGTS